MSNCPLRCQPAMLDPGHEASCPLHPEWRQSNDDAQRWPEFSLRPLVLSSLPTGQPVELWQCSHCGALVRGGEWDVDGRDEHTDFHRQIEAGR